MNENYTVWVGGSEINDYYLSLDEVQSLAKLYLDQGYDDVIIQEVQL